MNRKYTKSIVNPLVYVKDENKINYTSKIRGGVRQSPGIVL